MGPGPWDRDHLEGRGRHPVGGRGGRAASEFQQGHGVLHRGSAGRPPRGVACLSDCMKSQDEPVRTSPERNGVAQVLWCLAPSCSCTGIRRAAPDCPRDQYGSKYRTTTGHSDRMVAALMMDRQYSPQKLFLLYFRNFLESRRAGRRTSDLTAGGCLEAEARASMQAFPADATACQTRGPKCCLWTDQCQALTRGPHVPSL